MQAKLSPSAASVYSVRKSGQPAQPAPPTRQTVRPFIGRNNPDGVAVDAAGYL
jgi:hypothetical protein